MKFYVNANTPFLKVSGQLLIVPCFQSDFESAGADSTSAFAEVNRLTGDSLLSHARTETFSGKTGEKLSHYAAGALPVDHILLIGLGGNRAFSPTALQKALVKAFSEAKDFKADEVVFDARPILTLGIEGYALGQLIGTYATMLDYVPIHYKTKKGGHKGDHHMGVLRVLATEETCGAIKRGLIDGRSIADGVNLARDLSSTPAGFLTPFALKDEAEKVASGSRGLITGRYYWGRRLEQMKANALLAVSRGSAQKPVLIELDYTPPSGPTKEVLCLVGKSVTFDSGGLDLKPAAGMRDMKRDMAGGATVLGAIQAIAALRLPISVKVVMAATENMTGGAAYKPGDVIETMNGLTIEVDNTDAEGRLTLVDAIEFAKRRGVTKIVDFATLTGAVKSIGGDVGAACFGNKRDFTEMVASAGESQGERMINIPMWEELREFNHSDIADLKNSGGALAGSTTAAWLIREVAGEEVPWVHVDIAGVAFRSRALGPDPKGASGYGVRTAIALADALSRG